MTELERARQDKAFSERLAQRIAEDKPLLDRIESLDHGLPNCSVARLVESHNGGALLLYECECGARLVRSREQAEEQGQ